FAVDEQLTQYELLGQEVLDVFTNYEHFPTFDEVEHLKYLDLSLKKL
ncbi:14228_t:CDS:2, partial [Gigaspora margarita]